MLEFVSVTFLTYIIGRSPVTGWAGTSPARGTARETLRPMKKRKLTVELDVSTWRWLRALARANSNSKPFNEGHTVTAEEMLAQAAFCFADAAGRRTGSWEASVGQSMLDSSGYQASVPYSDYDRCQRLDEEANAKWRAENAASLAAIGNPQT